MISTDRIVIRKAKHYYGSCYRADALWMYLTGKKCRELGLFLLASGFHGPRRVTTLSLTHAESEIRQVRIDKSELRLDDLPPGLTLRPFALRYFPSETCQHPWLHCDAEELPVLALSNAEDCVGTTEEDWANRDTVWLGLNEGLFLLAELLLDAGCSWNQVRDYQLEGDAGFRGVGAMSAELRIFLPGSDGWLFPGTDVPDSQPDS